MYRKAKITITAGDGETGRGVPILVDLTQKGTDIVSGGETYFGEIDSGRVREAVKLLTDLCSGGYTGDTPKPAGQVEEGQYVLGESICDPLQDAIDSAAYLCERAKDDEGLTIKILQKHLMNLHALQIEMLRQKPEPMFPEYDLKA